MRKYVFDIETNGLLDELTKVHCLVLKDLDTGEKFSYANPGDPENARTLEYGVRQLMAADLILGHNVIKFDIPALRKVYPWFTVEEGKVRDTLVLSHLIWSDLEDKDWSRIRSGKSKMPGDLAGKHRLESWGYRLGEYKGDFKGPWDTWTQEMQDYCEQDIEVNEKLWRLIESKEYAEEAIDLSHKVAWILAEQERNGFRFNTVKAEALCAELQTERVALEEGLVSLFPPWWAKDGKPKTFKKTIRIRKGIPTLKSEGATYQPIKLQLFNPGSRDHIADRLQKVRGWRPVEFTPGGKPKVDETILMGLPFPEAKQLGKLFQVKKILGQLAEGDNAWLKKVTPDGLIHHNCIPNKTVTGRAAHSNPNLGQVPSGKAYRGPECRELFEPLSPDDVQVGCDVSGLELRMLGHFMAKFDGGAFAREVVEGDVHWLNVLALGLLPEGTIRDEESFAIHKVFREGTKTFIYAFLYGAGGEKVGSIILEIAMDEEAKELGVSVRKQFFKGKRKPSATDLKRVGNGLKRRFLQKTPALKKLIESVQKRAGKQGYLKGLDGRLIHVRSEHSALNTLLQSAGAIVCMMWLVEFHRLLRERGLKQYVRQMAWVHDEVQLSVKREFAEEVGKVCVEAIKLAGEHFKLRVPLDGEYKIGNNWRECH